MIYHFRRNTNPVLFNSIIDFHNHLIPGIDDGSPSINYSLRMLQIFEKLGLEGCIPSPHIHSDLYPNSVQTIYQSYQSLKNEASYSNFIRGYGAEYMLTPYFFYHLDKKVDLLPVFKNYLLVETPFHILPKYFNLLVIQLNEMGFQPILAHPERYLYIKTINDLINIKEMGCYLQLNATSLASKYGGRINKRALEILHKDLYDFVGTDAHSIGDLKLLGKLKLSGTDLKGWELICEKHVDHMNED